MTPSDSRPLDGGRWAAALSPARRRVAAAVGRLADALVLNEASEEVLAGAADAIERQIAALGAGTDRAGRIDALKATAYADPPADGARTDHNPDCIACGPGNPAGLGLVVHRAGSAVVGRLVVGPVARGAPGRAHGGVLALALDDLMGHVLVVHGSPAYTVELTVEYLAAAPVGQPIELRAWLDGRDGRRLTIRAEGRVAHEQVVRARGLFITVERLGS